MLFGPTAVGKTALLEDFFSGFAEVVNADSLQVYRGMDIGTSKPTAETLSHLPHHLIDILDFWNSFNVGEFCSRADDVVFDIHSRGLLPVISGGTAYYMKSWLMGLPAIPPSYPLLRSQLQDYWQDRPVEEMRCHLEKIDQRSAVRIGSRDRQRMLRAFEVFEQTGRTLSSFPVPERIREDMNVLIIGLRRKRSVLWRRIEERVNMMIEAGLEDEVEVLRKNGARAHHPGMKGIGYREWFNVNDGVKQSKYQIIERIIINTRRFAKRQMTFFSSLPGVQWIDMDEKSDIQTELKYRLASLDYESHHQHNH